MLNSYGSCSRGVNELIDESEIFFLGVLRKAIAVTFQLNEISMEALNLSIAQWSSMMSRNASTEAMAALCCAPSVLSIIYRC